MPTRRGNDDLTPRELIKAWLPELGDTHMNRVARCLLYNFAINTLYHEYSVPALDTRFANGDAVSRALVYLQMAGYIVAYGNGYMLTEHQQRRVNATAASLHQDRVYGGLQRKRGA